MASALSILGKAVTSFQPTTSVMAGGAAAVLTYAVGDLLVSLGLIVPILNIPLTIGMVATAAIPIGHLVTSLVPDSYNQQLKALAAKLETTVENVKSFIPVVEDKYPAGRNGAEETSTTPAVSNINQ